MGANSHKAIYNPEFNPGGLDAVNIATTSRLFDNFESYADSTALQVVWSTTAVTRTLETTSPLRGAKSLKGAVTNATNQIKATINPAIFQYPFPKKLRYITFKTTVDSGAATFTFKLWGSADEANNYKEWTVTPKDKYNDIVIDLDPDNTESSPAPTATGASWEPTTINRISFEDLTNARTYYFDDIIFYYEYSLVDLIGLGTEPPISIGTDGSLQARLNSIHADVKGLEGQTSQYAKQGIAVAEMGQALQWALELNSDFAPPTTTEIAPGTYDIDKIRAAVTTNMVNDSAASESAGTIYASYTPSETDWNVGDLIKVTFSGGYVRTDEEPSVALTATTAALGTTVTVANAYAFEVGWLVKLLDNNTTAEWHTISSIDSPTTFTIDAAVGEFTVAQSATVNRVIQTDLSTAIFFTMLQAEAQSYKILATGTLTTSSATVPADTGRTEADNYWKGSWLMPITGAISNQPRLIAIFTNVGGVFTLDSEQPFTAVPGLVEYIIIGPNSQVVPSPDGTNNQTPAHVVGNKADVAVYAASATASVIAYLKGVLGAAVIGTGTLTTSSATVPAATGRTEADNYWRGSWLMTLTGAVAFQPRLITSFANVGGVFTLDAQHPFTAAPGTVAYILLSPNQSIVPSADATTNTTPAHVIGNKTDAVKPIVSATASDTAYLKALVARGMVIIRAKVTTGASPTAVSSTDLVGFGDDFFNNQFYMQVIQAGGAVPEPKIRKITDYTSTTGAFVVDTFTDNVDVNDDILIIHESLVAIGRNDADNVFDSSTVVFNVNGSLLERNEFLEKVLTNSTEYTSSAATTTTITAAALADVASQYIGQVVIPLEGAMAGEGRYIAAYNGTDTLTITPAWASDPDAGGAIKFVIFSTGLRIVPTALGTDGTTVSDSSTTVLGAIGADNNNNAFSSTNVAANSDGSVLERLEHILVALGGTTGTTTALGTTTTAIDTVRTEAADYWNGGVFICVDGTNKGLARPIYDFDAAADTLYFEPAFPNAVASGVNYLILTRFDVARILGDNNANNAYDSSSVVENRDGSVLERLEYLFGEIEDDSDSVENRIGNLTTRGNDGNITAALGLDNLPDVASGDLYNILWKYLANTAISSPTTKA
ncbi:MAG: hypothetical protein Q7R49_06115, partial [Candidatus Daviesbacteria bacterium]|nr:hypothetical protein [Candidatus Daviesbacteria bacterium]